MHKLLIFVMMTFLLYMFPVALFGWEEVSYPKDMILEKDLIKVGDKIINAGTVKGDMVVAGTTIRNQGHLSGDLLALGSFIHHNGRAEGNARLLGTELLIEGSIEKNLSLAGLKVDLGGDSLVKGSLTAVANNISVLGKVDGNLIIKADEVTLSGEFSKDVEIYANSLTILPRAKFAGSVTYFGSKQPQVYPDATFATPLINKAGLQVKSWKQALLSLFGLLLLAGLTALTLPKGYTLISKRLVEKPGSNFIVGLGFLLLIPPLSILLFLLKLGSYSALALLAAYLGLGVSSFLLAQIAWGTALGKLLWGLIGSKATLPTWGQTGTLLGQTLLGTLIFALLGRIPYAGFVLQLILGIFSLGAIISLLFSAVRWSTPSSETGLTKLRRRINLQRNSSV